MKKEDRKYVLTVLDWDIPVEISEIIILEQYTCPECGNVYKCYESEDLGLPEVVVCPACQCNMKSLENSEGMMEFDTDITPEDLKKTGKTMEEVNARVGEILLQALTEHIEEVRKDAC